MDVREDPKVFAHENRVPWHAHVQLEVGGGLTVLIFDAEREHGQTFRGQRALAQPDNPAATTG
jgi:hypothetical protein